MNGSELNLDQLLSALLVSNGASIGIYEILLSLIVPFALMFPVTAIYQWTQKHGHASQAFVHSMFLFASLSSIMTLIIGNNIARAFGLIGALSIIRFRNALKSPLDAVYIFWALAIGMSCGTGYYFAGIFIVAITGAMVMLLEFSGYAKGYQISQIVKIGFAKGATQSQIEMRLSEAERVMKNARVRYKKVNTYHDPVSGQMFYVFMVKTKQELDVVKIKDAIGELEGIGDLQLQAAYSPFAS